jgi:hypothetical protein
MVLVKRWVDLALDMPRQIDLGLPGLSQRPANHIFGCGLSLMVSISDALHDCLLSGSATLLAHPIKRERLTGVRELYQPGTTSGL